MSSLTIANLQVSPSTGWQAITRYAVEAEKTVHYYDFADRSAAPAAHDGVDLTAFGRLVFFGSQLSPEHAASLIEVGTRVDWALLPRDADLVHADPAEQGAQSLYARAETFYRQFLDENPRVGAADVSKILHLNRPAMFPILDATVRVLYSDRAAAAWAGSTGAIRPRSGRSYWPVVREDLVAAADDVAQWRADLTSSTDARVSRLAALSDVRLWDIVVRAVGVSIR